MGMGEDLSRPGRTPRSRVVKNNKSWYYPHTMKVLNYTILLRPEPEGGFTVLVPSLPGCITYGKNVKEAKEMAIDAITLYIQSLIEDGEPIPSDEETITKSIRVPVRTDTKSQLYA